MQRRRTLLPVVLCTLSLATAAHGKRPPAAAGLAPAEAAAAARIDAATIAAHVRFLADDLLEGRGTASRGEAIAARYVAATMQAAGLAPGGDDGSYFQKVPLVGMTVEPIAAPRVKGPRGSAELAIPSDLVLMSGVQAEEGKIAGAEIVFVGYGIVAPEQRWDDYKDVDVRGKVVLVMNNDPSSDPDLFAGKTRLWYGRWDYKYLEAARKGAAGAIVIHTDESAAYPWQVVTSSNGRERFELPAGDEPRLVGKMWATEAASQRIAGLGGKDLDALRAAAETRAFRPVPLGVTFDAAWRNKKRNTETVNVLGVLPGKDPRLGKQAVVVSAHYDHLGVDPSLRGDAIFNGAVDNASGVAMMLAMARAAGLSERPRRSLLFAAVAAEEQGLLGSEWYCAHPTFPPGRLAADVNLDAANVLGRTRDVGFIGYGKSTLDQVVDSVAAAQGRTVHGDPFPDKGSFYRSDQFSFAHIGVPAIYARGGPTYVGRPADWGRQQQEAWIRTHYHQPNDEYDPKWDLGGMVEDAQLALVAALRIADAPALPAWKPGDEFEAARRKAIEEAAKSP